jgi:hypothetical protein
MNPTSEVPLNDVSDEERITALGTMSVQPRKMLEPMTRLKLLESLASGIQKPRTPAQVHFVEVVEGKVPATGAYERAFLKYRAALALIVQKRKEGSVS